MIRGHFVTFTVSLSARLLVARFRSISRTIELQCSPSVLHSCVHLEVRNSHEEHLDIESAIEQ